MSVRCGVGCERNCMKRVSCASHRHVSPTASHAERAKDRSTDAGRAHGANALQYRAVPLPIEHARSVTPQTRVRMHGRHTITLTHRRAAASGMARRRAISWPSSLTFTHVASPHSSTETKFDDSARKQQASVNGTTDDACACRKVSDSVCRRCFYERRRCADHFRFYFLFVVCFVLCSGLRCVDIVLLLFVRRSSCVRMRCVHTPFRSVIAREENPRVSHPTNARLTPPCGGKSSPQSNEPCRLHTREGETACSNM
jgi:hypothetical protein